MPVHAVQRSARHPGHAGKSVSQRQVRRPSVTKERLTGEERLVQQVRERRWKRANRIEVNAPPSAHNGFVSQPVCDPDAWFKVLQVLLAQPARHTILPRQNDCGANWVEAAEPVMGFERWTEVLPPQPQVQGQFVAG